MSTTLRYEGATVGYDAPVVSQADLEVRPGEVVGLIGPNGAGKTTLMRAVTGGASLLAGAVTLDGHPVSAFDRRQLARVVGVLPQTIDATFSFTARQFVEMGRHAHLSRFGDLGPADRAAVDEALALTDTLELEDQPVDTLSGGDLQRLTLAQALAQQPAVLLLDEPTSHLDLNHRLQVLDSVRLLADGGLAVLAVFHDLDMAARYSDRLAVVHDGRLRGAAPPDEVLTEATMADVFSVRAVIGRDAVTGTVQVLPVVRADRRTASRGTRVLLVSGSGTGAALMRRLVLDGFDVRAGALAADDTDHKVAVALDLPMVGLPPFGGMSADDEASVAAAAAGADVVVVVATPFGPMNVGNLRAVASVGVPTVLAGTLDPTSDFTRGEARTLWGRLAERGAITCSDLREIVRCIEEATAR